MERTDGVLSANVTHNESGRAPMMSPYRYRYRCRCLRADAGGMHWVTWHSEVTAAPHSPW